MGSDIKSTPNIEGYVSVIYIKWEESERKVGARENGCSLHLEEKDYKSFIEEYNRNKSKNVPDIYLRPCLENFFLNKRLKKVLVSPTLYSKIKEGGDSLRLDPCQELTCLFERYIVEI